MATTTAHQVDLRFRRGIARHARAAGRQGRGHRRDDARARARPRASRVHDHYRGVRGVHARRTQPPEGLAEQVDEALRGWRSTPASASAIPSDPLLVSVRCGARESMPGMIDTVLNLGLNDAVRGGPGRRAPATSALRGTPTGGSCRCSATSCAACPGERFEEEIAQDQARARRHPRHRARRRRAARADGRASRLSTTSPRTRASSSTRRSARCSTRGWASARWPTGASTASPTIGAPRSTSSRWSTATRARRRARAWPSAATRSPARPSRPATS